MTDDAGLWYRLANQRSMETSIVSKDTARLSSKFQISIPKAVRAAQGWQAGQVFAFIPRGANTEEYRDRADRV